MSLVVFGGLVALTAAGCGSTKTVTRTVTVPAKSTSDLGPPAVQTQFGWHVIEVDDITGALLTLDLTPPL